MSLLYGFVALCLSGSALAQVTIKGHCPKVETMKNFNISGIVGRWYDVEQTLMPGQGPLYKCSTITYSLRENGSVALNWTNTILESGKSTFSMANVSVINPADPAKLNNTFVDSDGEMWVLGSDYDSYIVQYFCTDQTTWSYYVIFVFTRDQNPDDSVMANVHKIVEKNGLSVADLKKMPQDKCDSANSGNPNKA